jgi:hypothetical protein
MLRSDGERHRVDVVGGDAGDPAPTAWGQHCLPADPGRLGWHDAGQHRCHRMAWYNNNPLIVFRFCLHCSGDGPSSAHPVDTGHGGVRRSYPRRSMGLPRHPVVWEKCYSVSLMAGQAARLHQLDVWLT